MTEGVRLDARKNGQIAGSNVVRDRWNAGSTAQPTYGFPATPPSAIVHAVPEFIWGISARLSSARDAAMSIRGWRRRVGAGVMVCCVAMMAGTARAQSPDDLDALNQQITQLYQAGKYGEAIAVAQRYVDVARKRYGEEDARYATAISWLGSIYRAQRKYDLAEPLFRRALAIDEKRLGPEHPDVASLLGNLAALLADTKRLSEAIAVAQRYVDVAKKLYGEEDTRYATALSRLGPLYRVQGKYDLAEPLCRRALAIDEKSLGPEHPTVAAALNDLGALLYDTNHLAEAEALYRRALAISEKSLGPELAATLNNLAALLAATDRPAEAEPLYRRALAIGEKGPEHRNVAAALNNLAALLAATNRPAEAEPLYRRALAIDEKSLGPEHPDVAIDLNNLAELLRDTNRLAEAEPLYRRALAINEKSLGPEHPAVATNLHNLALLLQDDNRLSEAEPLFRRALAIDEKNLGPEHPNVAKDLNSLAVLLEGGGDWSGALVLRARARPIMIGRGGTEAVDRTGLAKVALTQNRRALRAYARAVYHADSSNIAEGFELAQWALQTEAADAIAQMAARFARGEGPLADQVREQQDLLISRRGEDKRLLTAAGRADAKGVEDARAAIASIDQKLDAIDTQLAHDFKGYADLANPKPLTIDAARALLRDEEALILFLDTPQFGKLPEEALIWAVTNKEARWRSIPLGTSALSDRVTALRCGLDNSNWIDPEKAGWLQLTDEDKARWQEQQRRRKRCKELLGREVSERDPPPFNLAMAHELYHALLEPFADEIHGKKLLVVPSEPLSSLPLQVLIIKEPAAHYASSPEDYRGAAWLIKEHAITVLPAVTSLESLRLSGKASHTEAQSVDVSNATPANDARRPFIGFGNPLLFGVHGADRRAREAKDKQTCAKVTPAGGQEVAEVVPPRGGLTTVSDIRSQSPLPETADELCEVAQALHAPESDVYLGERATVTAVKEAPLNHYRIVHFATHGLLSSETAGYGRAAEGALVLTPPATATDKDDGLLTASDVAQLKLNADWVVLSACNTAAGDKPGAQPLSGLASAFFYARARALLASHWYVNSHAAAQITTAAFKALEKEPSIGYAEAFRRSMLAMMENPNWQAKKLPAAHPAVWAPFALVGEGSSSADTSTTSSQISASPQKP